MKCNGITICNLKTRFLCLQPVAVLSSVPLILGLQSSHFSNIAWFFMWMFAALHTILLSQDSITSVPFYTVSYMIYPPIRTMTANEYSPEMHSFLPS